MEDGLTSYFFTQGVLGVSCIVLGYVCGKLYKRNEALQERIEELHSARLADSKEVVAEVTGVIEGNSQNMRVFAEKIEVVQRGRENQHE